MKNNCDYNKANDPKQIILYEGAKHGLEEVAEQVHQVVFRWLVESLQKATE
jgi:hypothetical protein